MILTLNTGNKNIKMFNWNKTKKFTHSTNMMEYILLWRRASSGCTGEWRIYGDLWFEPI